MITDEQLDLLPDDPEDAFVQYEAILREEVRRLNSGEPQHDWDAEREYVAHVLAFVEQRELPLGLSKSPPRSDNDFGEWYQDFVRAVDYYKIRTRLQNATRKKENVSVLTLSLSFKTQIGGHLTAIRKIVAEADISASKRDAIYRRITNLQDEVDRDRTRTEAAMALLLDITSAVSNGAKNLDPALDRLERIVKIFAKAKDENEAKAIAAPRQRKRIAPPLTPVQTTALSSLDDEIPF